MTRSFRCRLEDASVHWRAGDSLLTVGNDLGIKAAYATPDVVLGCLAFLRATGSLSALILFPTRDEDAWADPQAEYRDAWLHEHAPRFTGPAYAPRRETLPQRFIDAAQALHQIAGIPRGRGSSRITRHRYMLRCRERPLPPPASDRLAPAPAMDASSAP